MKLIIFLKNGKKDCYLKKDTAMCDCSEIDFIEETSLRIPTHTHPYAYFNTFY